MSEGTAKTPEERDKSQPKQRNIGDALAFMKLMNEMVVLALENVSVNTRMHSTPLATLLLQKAHIGPTIDLIGNSCPALPTSSCSMSAGAPKFSPGNSLLCTCTPYRLPCSIAP